VGWDRFKCRGPVQFQSKNRVVLVQPKAALGQWGPPGWFDVLLDLWATLAPVSWPLGEDGQ